MRKILGVLLMVGGLISAAIGFTARVTHPFNTVMFFGGLLMLFIGTITLGITVWREYRRM